MNRRDEFLKTQKILRLSTNGKNKTLHIVPVWYLYSSKKFYVGTNTRTQKAKNLKKNKIPNSKIIVLQSLQIHPLSL